MKCVYFVTGRARESDTLHGLSFPFVCEGFEKKNKIIVWSPLTKLVFCSRFELFTSVFGATNFGSTSVYNAVRSFYWSNASQNVCSMLAMRRTFSCTAKFKMVALFAEKVSVQ